MCSAYLVPGTQCVPLRYTQSVWSNIPKILSLGTTGSVSVRGIFVNAQSLTKDKWDEVRTVGLRERVHIIAVAEVWGITNRDAQFMGYRRRLSRRMGSGRGMAVWVHADSTAHIEKVHDDRWVFAVLVRLTHHAQLIVVVHMPQRREPALYNQTLATLSALCALYGGIECIICGDWNRYVPTHPATERWLQGEQLYVHNTGREQREHKDWVVTTKGTDRGSLQYREGVADHPMIIFEVRVGRGWERDTQPVGHKPTGVTAWGQGDKQAWGAVMECVSGAGLTIHQWVTLYREVVAAVEEQRLQRQSQHSLREAMQAESKGDQVDNWVDVPEVRTMLHNKMWLAKMQERHVLEQIQQTGATTKILRIKKAGKLVHLSKIWETTAQAVVSGDRVRVVAAAEAQMKNVLPKHTPTWEWVRAHKPHPHTGHIHDKGARAARELVQAESGGGDKPHLGISYELRGGQGAGAAVTVAVDGIAAGMAVHAEVAFQHMQSRILMVPPPQLPEECLRVLHLPYEKAPGIVLNKHTRPIMLGSALPRQG